MRPKCEACVDLRVWITVQINVSFPETIQLAHSRDKALALHALKWSNMESGRQRSGKKFSKLFGRGLTYQVALDTTWLAL